MMPQGSVENNTGVCGCQVPVRSELVAEAVRLGWRIVSVVPSLPWVHLLPDNSDKRNSGVLAVSDGEVSGSEVSEGSAGKVEAFRAYRRGLAEKVIILENRANPSMVKVIRQADGSRYFPEGRRRLRGKVARRMGRWYSCNGVLLTLTYAPGLISREAAWKDVGRRGSRLMEALNVWRKRAGMSKVRGIRVLEVQRGTGYPHLHVVFPRLRWLAPIGKLSEWWGQASNSVDLAYRDSVSPVGYVCKYIGKLEGWCDAALAEIWGNRTRLYSMSRDYYVVGEERRCAEWTFRRTARRSRADVWLPELVDQSETVLGCNELAMEVYLGSGKG